MFVLKFVVMIAIIIKKMLTVKSGPVKILHYLLFWDNQTKEPSLSLSTFIHPHIKHMQT